MKDQYVGDVKDYFKYGLLRALNGNGLPLLVCWMLTPPDGRTHGSKTAYLHGRQFRHVDPELHDALDELVGSGDRRVAAIEASSLLRAGYVRTVAEARAVEGPPSLVFLDPDQGFEVRSVRPGTARSAGYVYWSDAGALLDRGHSVLVFQHWQRRRWDAVLPRLAERAQGIRRGVDVRAVVFGAEVAFVLLGRLEHATLAGHATAFASRCPDRLRVWAP